jgi:isoaspartyl peptidase/L-asparaginase-like protein (Ntn-hydrolase superfamily)
LKHIKNPIKLARLVMDEQVPPHVMICRVKAQKRSPGKQGGQSTFVDLRIV